MHVVSRTVFDPPLVLRNGDVLMFETVLTMSPDEEYVVQVVDPRVVHEGPASVAQ